MRGAGADGGGEAAGAGGAVPQLDGGAGGHLGAAREGGVVRGGKRAV